MKTEECINRTISVLQFYLMEREAILRIIGLVQSNNEFFNAKVGDDCITLAADKLEQLVTESKQDG